uniref:Ig-like domain-containing protein n=1 Tax=Mastacembelus armatus TaxID=205130 RepID=A0A3Q3SAD2_9TELE
TFPLISLSNRVTVTLQPSWSQIFVGETITVRCEIQGGGRTEWTYEWKADKLDRHPTHNEYRITAATESDSGKYSCRGRNDYLLTEWSEVITLTVSVPDEATVTLQPNWPLIYRGETITVRCEIQGGGRTEWTYEWKADKLDRRPTHNEYRITAATESDSGKYSCRGRNDYLLTEWSKVITLTVSHSKPGTTTIPVGGSVTLTCSVDDSDGWKYDWFRRTSGYTEAQIKTESTDREIRVSKGGIYRCRGGRGEPVFYTYSISNMVTVTQQHDWPQIFSGETITVRCEIQGAGDTEWDYEWRTTRSITHRTHINIWTFTASGSSSGDYMCKGRLRGDWYSSTKWSEATTVTVSYVDPAASLTVSPDRVQHFTSDSVSLSCEGNSAEWRVRRFPEDRSLSCPSKWRMTGSTCKISTSQSSAAVYWCESGSGEFSNSVNITFQNDIILLSPVLPVTEGDPVSLSCELTTENLPFNVEFYKNDKLVQSDTRLELNISAVSKSDEGFYKCKVMNESAQSWVSVKLSRPGVSSFLVPLITGLVCGLFLIILLMLLFCYKKSKGEFFLLIH